mgnify:CR=1 FL=1
MPNKKKRVAHCRSCGEILYDVTDNLTPLPLWKQCLNRACKKYGRAVYV